MALEWWFQAQNKVIAANRAEFEREYRWLNAAVELIFDVQQFVNTDPNIRSLRLKELEQNPDKHLTTNIVVNLVNDALGSLVNAIRLLLFGAHADAFALARSAFEACCYAEYFTFNTQQANTYMELEEQLSQDMGLNLARELRKRNLQPGSIMTDLEKRDGENRRPFYARLCNLGAHPSPKRVGLRLSAPKGAVLAAVSISTPDWSRARWTRGCAIDLMAVAKYAVEMLLEHYPDWFQFGQPLEERHKSLVQEFQVLSE
jgi:hypothetical protein